MSKERLGELDEEDFDEMHHTFPDRTKKETQAKAQKAEKSKALRLVAKGIEAIVRRLGGG